MKRNTIQWIYIAAFILLTSFSCEDVDGIATLDNQLFVISNESSTVCVFDLTSFTQLQTIELGGLLKDPWDIATCDATRRIYIADYGNKCVCRIDWSPLSRSTATVSNDSPSPSATKFIVCEGYRPWRLSTSGRRQQLLVTGYDGNSLHVYDVDGKLLRHVRLSTEVDDDGVKWFDVRHAVQATTGDDYFVCRLGNDQHQQWEWTHAEVAEYNSTGQRLRCYYSGPRGGGPLQLDKPAYMSLINDGCLLVVADSEARRVVLLNTELKLERVLLTRQQLNNENDDDDCRPSLLSLCYNSQTGLLCVGGCSGSINVYQIS